MCGYALNLASTIIQLIIDIKQVYYGASNDKFGGNGSIIDTSTMSPHPYNQIGGIMKDKAIEVLK